MFRQVMQPPLLSPRVLPTREMICIVDGPARTAVSHPKATRDLFKELEAKAGVSTDWKKLHQFADFLGQMFMLSPDRRITVSSALGHPFISEPM